MAATFTQRYNYASHAGNWTAFNDGVQSGENIVAPDGAGSITYSKVDTILLATGASTNETTNAAGLLPGFRVTRMEVNHDTNPAVGPGYQGVGTVEYTTTPDSVAVPGVIGDMPASAGMAYDCITGAIQINAPTLGADPWAPLTFGLVGEWDIDFAITSVSPNSGPVYGGTAVTITGGPFWTGAGGTTVRFGKNLLTEWYSSQVATNVVVVNSTTITCVVQDHLVGLVDVHIALPAVYYSRRFVNIVSLGFAVGTGLYTFTPIITEVVPRNGINRGGTAVTIFGDGFINGATVKFNGVLATDVVFVSGQALTAVTPAYVGVGAVDVTVTETVDSVEYTPTLVDGYYYDAINRAPIIHAGENSTLLSSQLGTPIPLVATWIVEPTSAVGVLWTFIGGPATPTITDSTSMTASTTFVDYVPGNYVFQIESGVDPVTGVAGAAAQRTITIPVARRPKVSNIRTSVQYP